MLCSCVLILASSLGSAFWAPGSGFRGTQAEALSRESLGLLEDKEEEEEVEEEE